MTASDSTQSAVAMPSVSFVVPVRNDARRLGRCLQSITANAYPGRVQILVADNGSEDGSADVARAAGASVLTFPMCTVAKLRNAAAAAATGDVLAFVDADHIIDAAWLQQAVSTLTSSGAGAIGAPYVSPEGATWVQRAYDRLRTRMPGICEVEWLGSGNLAIRRDVFLGAGGFDITLESCEDVDLCNRLRKAGYALLADDRLRSVHWGDPATLKALFLSELWRGRDNIKVTLRGPLTLRALPSVVVPVVNLALLTATMIGAVAAPWQGARLAAASAAAVVASAMLRAWRMTRNANGPRVEIGANMAVALVYEVARALALVARATHRTRRGQAGA